MQHKYNNNTSRILKLNQQQQEQTREHPLTKTSKTEQDSCFVRYKISDFSLLAFDLQVIYHYS